MSVTVRKDFGPCTRGTQNGDGRTACLPRLSPGQDAGPGCWDLGPGGLGSGDRGPRGCLAVRCNHLGEDLSLDGDAPQMCDAQTAEDQEDDRPGEGHDR